MQKYTIEAIEASLRSENFQLAPGQCYKNLTTKLIFICPKGHRRDFTWHGWLKGHRCKACYGNIRLTTEYIQAALRQENWELAPNQQYTNTRTKIWMICPAGHKRQYKWNSWQSGWRCAECSGNSRLSIEIIDSILIDNGWQLEPNQIYTNSKSRLWMICPNKHKVNIEWSHWQQKQKCLDCAGYIRINLEYIESELINERYTLEPNQVYINNTAPLHYVCPNGHKMQFTWNNWKNGGRCAICMGNARHTIEFVKQSLAKEDWILIDDQKYKNTQS